MSYNNNTLPRSNKVNSAVDQISRARPVSLYDNIQQQQQQQQQELQITDPFNAPSQALCLSTTVPVNIARSSIAGRHTPTRASVRHSRMLVLSQQTGRVPWKYLPPVMRWHRLASLLMFLLIISGISVLVIATYLAIYAPYLAIYDLPFWSGVLNLMAGIAGFTLACWCRRLHPGITAPNWVCVARMPYIAICIGMIILASAASLCAFMFTIVRFIWYFQVKCLAHITESLPYNTAMLKVIYQNETLTSSTLEEDSSISSSSMGPNCVCNTSNGEQFEGLACSKVRFDLVAITAGSGALHVVAACLAFAYLLLHWKSRRYGQPVHTDLRHTSPSRVMATSL